MDREELQKIVSQHPDQQASIPPKPKPDLTKPDKVRSHKKKQPKPEKRKKPGNPGHRATRRQMTERVATVARMLCKQLYDHQIKRYARDQWGIGHRQAMELIARAREFNAERAGRPREEFLAEAIGRLEEILRNPEVSNNDVYAVHDRLSRIMGLDAPLKVAPTTPDGEKEYSGGLPPASIAALTLEQLAELRELGKKAQAIYSPPKPQEAT